MSVGILPYLNNTNIMNYKLNKLFGLIVMLLFAACSSDNDPDAPYQEQQVLEGMEMYTRAYVDGKLVEEVIDEVKNFGTSENPMLFHVNKSHKVNGHDIPSGPADLDCVFLSLTQEEYEGFIRLFAIMQGLAETDQLTAEQKKEAFTKLFAYLKQYDIDLPLLVYLSSGNVEELQAVDKIIKADSSRADELGIDANMKLRQLLLNGIKASQAVAEMEKEKTRAGYVFNPCRLVVDDTVYDTDQKFRIVHDAKKVSNYDRLFASFINIRDLDLSHYWGSHEWEGSDYEVTYGSKLTPMSHIKFHVMTNYMARCETQPGRYAEKVQVVIDKSSRTSWMRCDVDVLFSAPTTYDYSTQSGCYAPHAHMNKVLLTYGDKALITYKGTLAFDIYGWDGYHERFWQDW